MARKNIVERTRRRLQDATPTGVEVGQIAKKAKVSRSWLVRFRQGQFTDPGVLRMLRLNRVLTGESAISD